MTTPFPQEELQNIIHFHSEDIDFQLDSVDATTQWIKDTILAENQQLNYLNFIFCSDNYLHKINVEYLDHDTLTDVITFPYAEEYIEGDIFISIDRIRDNANTFKSSFEQEIRRVIIHGVLHLCGYRDKTSTESQIMRNKESFYLEKYPY